MAHPYCGTDYLGTDGRWNGANSPIGPWSHGYEGGAGRGYRTPSIALTAVTDNRSGLIPGNSPVGTT